MRTIGALVAVAGLLNGCSSPYLYQKEVASFGSSVAAVSDGVTQGIDNLDQDQVAADLGQVVGARSGLDLDPVCGSETASGPCRIMVHGRTLDSYVPGKFAEVKGPERKVVVALKAYADGLAAVTNAQDRKDYDAAASQLASSVAGLGTALGAVTPAGAAAGPALSAVVTFATWIVGEALDAARFKTLRSAVNAVGTPSADLGGQSAIQVVADKAITPALRAIKSARLELLIRELNAREDRINADLSAMGARHVPLDRYDMPVTELSSVVATLNSVRAVDPAAVSTSLVNAHNALVEAVNDKSRQFQTLLSSVADFSDKAAAVEKAFATKPTAKTATTK
jgi:hypothetical protein